jgi:DNA adenine methylase
MLTNLNKAPFPYFGGKSKASPAVWEALGDVEHYVEPFCGSMAVLLNRPHEPNRPYHSETVCDVDGLLINAWRGIQLYPEETAFHASNPVALRLMADPHWCDPMLAGWWLWGCSCWIGSGWCANTQAWVFGPDGRLTRRKDLPEDYCSEPWEPGVSIQIPHLGNDGRGANRPGTREPGVKRPRPHLSNDGQGVNRPGTREPGVKRPRPHLSNDGQGVNHAGTREPGVKRQIPLMVNAGRGVYNQNARELGVSKQKPFLNADGQGVNIHTSKEIGLIENEFNPVTMPELRRWFNYLSERLRHVNIINGDWQECISNAFSAGSKKGICGVFLDPPYADTANRKDNLYAHDSLTIAHDAVEWCLKHGDDPELRIVLAGFDREHGDKLLKAGWTEKEWFAKGHLTGGMGNINKDGHQQERERLWLSPNCNVGKKQMLLIDL